MHVIKVFDSKVKLLYYTERNVIVMEWTSTPVTDMYSDAIMSAILQAQINPIPIKHLPANLKEEIRETISKQEASATGIAVKSDSMETD
ncbi:hypothetical protein M3Y98_00194700 [Aphelenchoides besseyi]|nr:hypothetical protein M3Y98_00194700 [Aphelenchoides besseyi]